MRLHSQENEAIFHEIVLHHKFVSCLKLQFHALNQLLGIRQGKIWWI